jgi:hypothetical protein
VSRAGAAAQASLRQLLDSKSASLEEAQAALEALRERHERARAAAAAAGEHAAARAFDENRATLASLQSDDAHWAANLASSADTTVVLTLRSRIDPGQQATLSVLVRAQPLNVDVLVGAGIINPSPLVAGDTFLVNLKSGQTLTVKSSRDTSVVLGESSVRASNVISGARQWQGRLNAAVAAEVLITVTDLQDSSRKVTLRVVVAASSLALDLRVNGVLSNTEPIVAGEVYNVSIASGQAVAVSGPAPFSVLEALNGASKTGFTSGPQSWAATLASNASAVVTLVVSDATDSTSFATIKISIDPLPLALNVEVAGTTVNTSPIVDGQTSNFTIQSGQAVVIRSTGLRISVAEALSNAVASARTNSPSSWGATLSSTATTEATLTVRPQGDATRGATIKFNVIPNAMQLNVTAAGKLVNATPLIAGQVLQVPLTSGGALVIDSTVAMTVTETLNTAVRSDYAQGPTRYAASFAAPAGSQVELKVASVADPSLKATVLVSVAPVVYTSTIPRSSNEFSRFESTSTRVDGGSSNQSTTRRVTSANGDGSYTTEIKVGEEVLFTEKDDVNGNLLTFNFQTTGKSCNYSPQRTLLDFPLYVGKNTSSTWSSTCSDGISEYVAANMQVQGIETVNIGSTSVEALRVQITLGVTGSNDPNLDGGAAGSGAYSQVWFCKWAINLQRMMFCSYTTTFIGVVPASYLSSYSETMTQYIKP